MAVTSTIIRGVVRSLSNLVGQDLAGWTVAEWYVLNIKIRHKAGGSDDELVFSNPNLATAIGLKANSDGSDATPLKVIVLASKDGRTGFCLNAVSTISLSDEKQAIARIKEAISPSVRRALGIE